MDLTGLKSKLKGIFILCGCLAGLTASSGNWELIESSSGISMYERWVKISDDLTVRERKGEMVVKSDLPTVVRTLSDPAKTKLWMENVTEARLVKKLSENEWASYTMFSLPWPLKNRDMVSVSCLKYPVQGTAVIEMASRENFLPLNRNVTRLTNYKATWKISDLGNGHVLVSMAAISVTNPEYPRFILDPVVRGVFMRNLYKLRLIITV